MHVPTFEELSHLDPTITLILTTLIIACSLSVYLITSATSDEHIHTPSSPLILSPLLLVLIGAASGILLQYSLPNVSSIDSYQLYVPSTLGALAYLAMSISSYNLWGVVSFGAAITLSLTLATMEVNKLVIACGGAFLCAFVVSLARVQKQFRGSEFIYLAVGWFVLNSVMFIWQTASSSEMFLRPPAFVALLLAVGNVPGSKSVRTVRAWQSSTALMLLLSAELLLACLLGGIHIVAVVFTGILYVLIYVWRQRHWIYGPYTKSERTAQVWLSAAVVLVSCQVADADVAAGEMKRGLYILAVLVGATATFITISVFATLVSSFAPVNSKSYRMSFIELGMCFGYVFIPIGLAFLHFCYDPDSFAVKEFHTISTALRAISAGHFWGFIPDSTVTAVLSMKEQWGVVISTVTLTIYLLAGHRALSGVSLVWAPLLSETVISCYDVKVAEEKKIALTFDGGPHNEITSKILDLLREHKAKATFFVRGHAVTRWPGLINRIQSEGHQVESQCLATHEFNVLPGVAVRSEMDLANAIIAKEANHKPRWIRNVSGFRDHRLHFHAARSGMRVVYWTVCPWDWEGGGVDSIASAVMEQVDTVGGDIVRLTEANGFSGANHHLPSALAEILQQLADKGFKFCTLDDMSKEPLGTFE